MPSPIPKILLDELLRRGYTIHESADGREQQVIRPDGTVAMTARAPERP